MKEKLREFLRPRLALLLTALLLTALLLAAYLPAMPAARAAGGGPADAWEDQDGVRDQSFNEAGTTLDSYTYYNSDGTTETVTINPSAVLGSKENPISIPDETALILFGKLESSSTNGKYYILDKTGGEYDMGAHTMLPLMGTYTSTTSMATNKRPFQGVLIGNKASIENVYIKSPYESENSTTPGLFGILDGAEVMDLAVSLTYFDQENASSFSVGGIAATVEGGGAALVNLTAKVSAADESRFGSVGGLVGRVDRNSTMTLTNCTAEVAGSLTAGEYGNAGGLVGYVESGTVTLTDCAAQTVITGRSPSGPVGYGRARFTGVNVTTLRMGTGSRVYLALVNGTTLTLDDSSGVLTATGNVSVNGIPGSVTVGSNGDAEINVRGGADSGGATYTLTGVNGTIRLEDKTPASYWVTLDAGFTTTDPDPLAKGDAVNLLGAAGNRLCTVAVKAGTGGSVSVTNDGPVSVGTEVTVTATPDSDYRFVNWTEGGQQVSTEADYTFTVTSSRTLTAVFEAITPQYTVTVQAGTGGSAIGDGTFDAGTSVTVTATPESGYRFVNWTEDDQQVSTEARYTFTVTSSRMLTAVFERTSSGGGGSSGGGYTPPSTPTYPPTVEKPGEGGGTPTISPSNPKPGDTVTVKPKPDEGYEVDKITVTERDGKPIEVVVRPDGTYTFKQPDGTVKIEVSYKEINTPWVNPFADVSEGDWYYEAVRFVQEQGLMSGYSDGRFAPEDTLSRSQLAQILFNKEGRPGVSGGGFDDVDSSAWYTEAVRWAAGQGIVSGYGDGTFGPNDPITREQLAVMLWRYSGSPAATGKELHFNDTDEISGFALEALRWAVENGILNGDGGGRLGPKGQATRAETAQMLKNFIKKLKIRRTAEYSKTLNDRAEGRKG